MNENNEEKTQLGINNTHTSYMSLESLPLPYESDLNRSDEVNNCSTVVKHLKHAGVLLSIILYHVYLGFAIHYDWERSKSWCDGCRILVIITFAVYFAVIYYLIIKPLVLGSVFQRRIGIFLDEFITDLWSRKIFRWIFFILLASAVITFYIINSWNKWYKLIPLGGMFCLLSLGYIFSNNRKQIIWRHIIWGIGIQFCMGLITLKSVIGGEFFQCLSDKVRTFLSYGDAGSTFVFDYLASGNITAVKVFMNDSQSFQANDTISYILIETVFAFKVLPVILFFSFFISILYYYGIMQTIIIQMGWLLYISIGTTAAESMNAAASVFVGMTEAPLMIRPYIPLLTKSELHAVMAGGFATIAGTVFAAYISFGINGVYLLSGAIMSAPAALAYSKLLYPETHSTSTNFSDIKIEKREERNVLEAASNGASAAISLVAGIATGLIVFISFIQFVNGMMSWAGSLIGYEFITLEWVLGKIFIPLAFLMGVEWKDCTDVGVLIGIKTVVNEFVAYERLSRMSSLSERSRAIATYALCSFSNFSSLGMQIGVLGAMVPSRKAEIAEVGFRALCAGAAACFLTACLAGSLLD